MPGSYKITKGMILQDWRGHQRQVANVTDEESPWVFFTDGGKLLSHEVQSTMTEAAIAPNPNDPGPE